MSDEVKNLGPFEAHGVEFLGDSGNQRYGVCPFCGKEKFYVNTETGQWDCKHGDCMRRGNVVTFMEQVLEFYKGEASSQEWRKLSGLRGIPVSTFKKAGMVWNGEKWLLPVLTVRGTVQDIRTWKPSSTHSRLFSTKGRNVGLFGVEQLRQKKRGTIYVCEGEWDTLALRAWLGAKTDAAILGVPGAGTWKPEWTALISDRDVVFLYDNDKAGKEGMGRAASAAAAVCKSVKTIHWPSGLPEGYDIRDAYIKGQPFSEIEMLLHPFSLNSNTETETETEEPTAPPVEPISWDEALATYKKWLHVTEEMEWAIKITFATVLSNRLQGDPLWLFLVGPPGVSKTELLMPLQKCSDVVIQSTVTPHSLVSGYQSGGKDPSLLPLLNGKTFVLKDFTEVLDQPGPAKAEIYAYFRGAYDGLVEKRFGNGIHRSYRIHFSMLAGVTQKIYADKQASLGERFLRYRLASVELGRSDDVVRAAIENVSMEDTMREELADAALAFLVGVSIREVKLPTEYVSKLVALAQLVAMLRGEVERDFKGDRLLYKPEREIGTRIAKQLKKLAISLAMLYPEGKEDWNEVWAIVRRVALDSCIGFNRTICSTLLGEDGPIGTPTLIERTGIPYATIYQQLEDLELLRVVEKVKVKNPAGRGAPMHEWRLSDLFVSFCKEAGITDLRDDVPHKDKIRRRGVKKPRRKA